MFQVGDILIGNEENPYPITNMYRPVEVVKIVDEEIIAVKVLSGARVDTQFDVESKYFSCLSKPKEPTADLMSIYAY